jgi:hypothetical protein
MEKITGRWLLSFKSMMEANGLSKDEIVKQAGYIRPNGKASYTAFYEEILRIKNINKREELIVDSKNKRQDNVIYYLLEAIKLRSPNYNYRNDWAGIGQPNDVYIVRHYDKKIAEVTTEGIRFFMPSAKSKSTKRRINAIMERFLGVNLFQKNGEWLVTHPLYFEEKYTDGMLIKYPEII